MIKEQVKAVSSKIKNPTICLNEKVLSDIKKLKIDQEVTLILKGKVSELSRERDYDYDMSIPEKKMLEVPKILKADFEIMKAEVK